MLRMLIVSGMLVAAGFSAVAQFRGQEPRNPSVTDGVTRNISSETSFFSPDRFEMHHSVMMSYGMFGGAEGLGSSMYINSLRYTISEPLSIRADIGMLLTTFGNAGSYFQNDVSRIFLHRASVDYAPSKDFKLTLLYRRVPYLSRYSGWGYDSGFGYDLFDDENHLFR